MEALNITNPVVTGEEQAYRKGIRHGIEQGLREGLEKGARCALLDILFARGIRLSARDRRQIAIETSVIKLRIWTRRALTANSAAEILHH